MNLSSVFLILGILVGLNILAWLAVFDLNQSNLEVTFFSVGQGDAAFVETPQHRQILIDGGPDSTILEKLGEEMAFWDRTIDLVVLTHPEHDHIAGLLEVLASYRVKNVLWSGILRDTAEYRKWQNLIEAENANIYTARSGQRIKEGAVSFQVLHPFDDLAGRTVSDTNNTSVILRLVFGQNSFLLTGDAYQSVEKDLVRRGAIVEADVLKVGHHGSKTSTAAEFVAAVSPAIAVISAGRDNSYGHPHPEVLDTLTKYGINILRTDIQDDIKIISDGKNYAISSF